MSIKCKGMRHRPDSLFSWLVCVCAAVCQALSLGFAVSYGVLLPEIMKEFGESRQKTAKNFRRWQLFAVGIVSVGGSIGVLIIGPLLRLLIDVFGWRGACRIISAPLIAMSCVCGATFGDPIDSDSFQTTAQNYIFDARESARFAMETANVNMNFVEDFENLSVYKDQTGKINEEGNGADGIESLSAVTYQNAEQISFTVKSRQVVAKDNTPLSKFLDFSVFAVPSYTVAVMSLLLMNFGHFIPQIHLCIESTALTLIISDDQINSVGFLADISDRYTWAFLVAGIVVLAAGLVPLVMFCLKTKKQFDLTKKTGKGPVTLYRDGNNCQLLKL
ncbi:Monocarboxylate transporter 12 [Stylophora pistillata]|uniref:Monocarboxylate transporter 12 n=1 Tax=Stylophora pistillata TaxID=50429 RepID=A0A2B4SP50_STYPI|nr:Monocarboxylate transporter 12 [Stylophora pistillata]